MRVLLVEDDRKAARVLRQGLHEKGCTVDVAHAGDEGEYQAEINDHDVIVLDWLLPGKSGIDVCRDLRGRGVTD
jgi:DNA-binding response OmpR family regulator